MGEKSDAKLMYSIDGKEFMEVSEITDLATSSEEADITKVEWFRHPQELTFTCDINPLQLLGIFLDEPTLKMYARTLTNNWRRRHGLPMRRKHR